MSVDDKRTIGVTRQADLTLALMVEQGHFRDAIDAAKFAMGVAVSSGGSVGNESAVEGATTKWNVGSFDPDGQIGTLLSAMFPDITQPYRTLEYLISEGLKKVKSQIDHDGELELVAYLDACMVSADGSESVDESLGQ